MFHEKIDLVAAVEPIIRLAGSLLLTYFKDNNYTVHAKTKDEIVTQADIASEKLLIAELKKVLPEASFFAEESGKNGNNDYCWVIDPLDGTTNFAHGLHYFCISVALTYKGEPIFGMIYQPILDELFYAYKDKGAFLNGECIHLSEVKELAKSMIVVGLPYKKDKHFMDLLKKVDTIAPKTYAMRYFGAVALDQANVAAGKLEGVFFEKLGWWDVAAGMLLVQEAGGKVSTFDGSVVRPDYHSYVAASPELHTQLLPLLKNSNFI